MHTETKIREWQRGTRMARAHWVTKSQRRRQGNLQKRIPRNHERGANGHNINIITILCLFCIRVSLSIISLYVVNGLLFNLQHYCLDLTLVGINLSWWFEFVFVSKDITQRRNVFLIAHCHIAVVLLPVVMEGHPQYFLPLWIVLGANQFYNHISWVIALGHISILFAIHLVASLYLPSRMEGKLCHHNCRTNVTLSIIPLNVLLALEIGICHLLQFIKMKLQLLNHKRFHW